MSDDPLRANLDDRPFPPALARASDARPAWMGFLGGVIVLVLAILIALAIWRYAGERAPPLTPEELTELESLLDRLGFPPGAVDGVIDEASSSAIRDFQLTAGLEVNGTPSIALLDELRAAQAELAGN